MNSKDFKKTVKSVSRNFQRYTQAMEADIQVLITSMLDVIEGKIIALRKLLKLKLCIKNVRSVAALEYISNLDDTSLNPTYTLTEKKGNEKQVNDSLEDLSSMIYEIDKNSLPREDNLNPDETIQKKLRHLEDIADIESLCSALNHYSSKINEEQKDGPPNEDAQQALDKYIYLLLDAKRQREHIKEAEETNDLESHKIGDFSSPQSDEKIKPVNKYPSQDSVVYLGKTEYESILDILNMVLRSYKMQEETKKNNKNVEKIKTEPSINVTQPDDRKIVSDSTCQNKDSHQVEKKPKNRKNSCI